MRYHLPNGVGESSIEDIHPGILSGIDIWRGPTSALWGSGLGGMIHLKTQIPESDQWLTKIQVGAYNRLSLDQGISLRYGKDDAWVLHCIISTCMMVATGTTINTGRIH